jgi:ATP-dependent Lon protease
VKWIDQVLERALERTPEALPEASAENAAGTGVAETSPAKAILTH